jgi:hypothetical protein
MTTTAIVFLVVLVSSGTSLWLGRVLHRRARELEALELNEAPRVRLHSEIHDLDDQEAVSVLRVVERLKEERPSEARLARMTSERPSESWPVAANRGRS